MEDLSYADWQELRRSARHFVAVRSQTRFPGLQVGPIDYEATTAAARTWPRLERRVTWDWKGITKNRETKRIDAAFWVDEELCGLSYGLVTSRGATLTRLEGSPRENHPLKGYVTDLAIALLEAVSLAVEAPRTLLQDPDPNLIEWYRRFGYERVAQPELTRYLVKERRKV
ncbi:hypothetical protein [Salinarimonas ramus]|uniref:N-acetyltransferase domain-containing protein n=1 Tax=Salinarimonas ramus TaxID=690164 RepID=A0A917Q606_9HYPH|nr:hypothetical protein [Salinarimonas ramus]GGK26965.1 hypothetical protein GCM10011322_11800 [Salinarimonas ramus]